MESEPEEGTTFIVELPLLDAGAPDIQIEEIEIDNHVLKLEPAQSATTEKETFLPSKNWSPAGARCVLVVEDHDELRHYIRDILQPDFQVIQARDGQAGLKTAIARIPDLIISDVMMPKMSGYELCEKLKNDKKTSHIPIILVTARAETEDRLLGLKIGVDDYLVKPFNTTELKTRVNNLIRQRDALKEKYSKTVLSGKKIDDLSSVEEAFLTEIREHIEAKLGDEHFSVDTLAQNMNMSVSQLRRKLKSLTELSPLQVIQGFRLQRAAALLKKGYPVNEVCYEVGLSSPSYFSQLFKKHFGCSPTDFVEEGRDDA